jgi:hypothetical protein
MENCQKESYCKNYCRSHYNLIKTRQKNGGRSQRDPNEIIIDNNICKMKLYNKKCKEVAETIFDHKYKLEIEKLKWHLHKNKYVEGTWYDENGKQQNIRLHQLILYLSGKIVKNDEQIDHIDGNGLNNLISNLRIATPAQNTQNQKINKKILVASKVLVGIKDLKNGNQQ